MPERWSHQRGRAGSRFGGVWNEIRKRAPHGPAALDHPHVGGVSHLESGGFEPCRGLDDVPRRGNNGPAPSARGTMHSRPSKCSCISPSLSSMGLLRVLLDRPRLRQQEWTTRRSRLAGSLRHNRRFPQSRCGRFPPTRRDQPPGTDGHQRHGLDAAALTHDGIGSSSVIGPPTCRLSPRSGRGRTARAFLAPVPSRMPPTATSPTPP